jgi:hypothetical protein
MSRTKIEIQKDIDFVKGTISYLKSYLNSPIGAIASNSHDIQMQRDYVKIQNKLLESYGELKALNQELSQQEEKIRNPERYYQNLIDKKKVTYYEKEFSYLAEEFRAMKNYKDSWALAKECDNAAVKVRYNRLVQKKNSASTENEYQNLANQFKAMNGYENTAELAKECDNAAVKIRYNRLVQEKNNASTENEYQNLANQFRAMNGYENTAELANECEAKKEKKWLFRVIFRIVLGGIIGGLAFAFFHTVADEKDFIANFATVAGILCFILALVTKEGCGTGFFGLIIGAIVGAIIAAILSALLPKIPFISSVAIGATIGVLPGWIDLCEIKKEKKRLYWTIFIALSSVAIALTFINGFGMI